MAYSMCQLYCVKDDQVSGQTCLGMLVRVYQYEIKQISLQLGCISPKVLKDWAESRTKCGGWLILSSWLLSRDVNVVFLKWDRHHVFSGFPGLWSWPRVQSTGFLGHRHQNFSDAVTLKHIIYIKTCSPTSFSFFILFPSLHTVFLSQFFLSSLFSPPLISHPLKYLFFPTSGILG